MKSKKKVLVLRAAPIYSDPRVTKEVKALYEENYDISILYWERYDIDRTSEIGKYAKIIPIRISAPMGGGIKNIFSFLKWQIELYKKIVQLSPDIIHACDLDTGLAASLAVKKVKARFVYDIFDFYADRKAKLPEFLRKQIRKWELKVIERADGVIICDEYRKKQIEGAKYALLEVIYNTPEDMVGLKDSVEVEKLRKKLGDYKLIISYTGGLYPIRDVVGFAEFVAKKNDYAFLIAGTGPDRKKIEDIALRHKNIVYFGNVPYRRALEIEAASDLIVALYDPSVPNNKFSSPNKLFEAMMLGIPVIVSKGTSMDKLVKDIGNGMVVPYKDYVETENALIRFENVKLREELGRNGREAYEKKYSWDSMKRRLIELYKSITMQRK